MRPHQYEVLSANRAREGLERTTGLRASMHPHLSLSCDGQVVIDTDDGRTFDLPYDVKTSIDRRDQLLSFKNRHGGGVLITRELSRAMADQCRELGIQFIDHAGNCFLKQPGLFVFVTGLKESSSSPQVAARGLTPAALRVVFAVLTRPSILNSNIRHIADVAAISHGAAGTAMITLEEAGYFTSGKSGKRVLAMPGRWLDTWTEGYLGRIRPKLEKYRMSAPIPIPVVLERVSPRYREVILGGEAAASARTFGLKPGTLTLYIDLRNPGVMRDIVQELKLRRDPNGQIELVDMFWNTSELESFPTVPDGLIYADLIGTADERTMEIAAELRKEICANVESKAG